MESSIKKNIAIFIPGRLYRNYSSYSKDRIQLDKHRYDFSFLKTLKQYYEDQNINVYLFTSLSKECEIPFITNDFIKTFDISNSQINIEDVICPSIIYNFSKRPETNYENTYKMFYHNYKCYELIEKYSKNNDVIFDVLMKWRTDIIIDNIRITNFLKKTIEHFLSFKNDSLFVPSQDLFWGISDQLAYGNLVCMKNYCLVITNLIKLCNNGCIYHPETLLYANCVNSNITINKFDLSYRLL